MPKLKRQGKRKRGRKRGRRFVEKGEMRRRSEVPPELFSRGFSRV
jgi:hypothetical protein